MKQILSIIKYTLKENLKNRVYLVLVIFSLLIIFISWLITVLGGEEPIRILLDFGLVTIEFFALLMMIFSGVSLILHEMDSKIVYLILVRPIPRWYYLIGRYLGLLFSSYLSVIFMAIIHVLLLLYSGWKFEYVYLLSILASCLKIAILGSLAIFFSLFSTSAISSLVFTFLIWVAGHFGQEMKFLINKMTNVLPKLLMKIIIYILPNFQYLNWRDFIGTPGFPGAWQIDAIIYGVTYSIICLLFSVLLFKYKEF